MIIYWIDIETTGLDPNKDTILEIAVKKANFLDPFNTELIYNKPINIERLDHLDDFILKMHSKNGLLKECLDTNNKIASIEAELLLLIPAEQNKDDKPIMAGSSIHFDFSFIKAHMPTLIKRFSYRLYDVSAIELFCCSLGMDKMPKAEAHRALADIEESIARAKYFNDWFRNRGAWACVEKNN